MWTRLFEIDNVHIGHDVYGNVILSLREVFTTSGVDSINHTLDDHVITRNAFHFQTDWRTLLLTFLGFPMRDLSGAHAATAENMYLNLLRWQPDETNLAYLMNRFILLPLNLLAIPFRLLTNIIKIATEWLPLLVSKLIIMEGIKLEKRKQVLSLPTYQGDGVHYKGFKSFIQQSVLYTLFLVLPPIMFLYWLGRSFSSPIDNLRYFWKLLDDTWLDPLGKPFLALFGLGLTLTIYGVLLVVAPLVIPDTILSLFVQHLPSFILSAIEAITTFLTPVLQLLAPIAITIIHIYIEALTFHFVECTPLLTASPLLIGTAALISVTLATVGTTFNEGIKQLERWWHRAEIAKSASLINLAKENELRGSQAFITNKLVSTSAPMPMAPVQSPPSPVVTPLTPPSTDTRIERISEETDSPSLKLLKQ